MSDIKIITVGEIDSAAVYTETTDSGNSLPEVVLMISIIHIKSKGIVF